MSRFFKKVFARPYLALLLAVVFLASSSIHAQIKNIYDTSEDNVSGITSLMSAVVSGDVNGVKFFSRAGGALINQKNLGGATALHMACREGNFEIIKILIDNGADVNLADNEGWTPLMRAALIGSRNAVDLLLVKGAQASMVNSSGESALLHATSSDCSDCLSLMFEKFNFVKFTDVETLKVQLADAFVVARSRNNQISQDMIAAYLDRVSKIAPIAPVQHEQPITTISKGKKFIFKSDVKPTPTIEVESTPIAIEPVEPEGKFTQQAEPVESEGKFTQQDVFVTKFKFVVGEQSKSREQAKGKGKVGVIKKEKSEAAVVLQKEEIIEEIVEPIISANRVVYKFNSGPKGKKIKRKVMGKEVNIAAQPTPVTPAAPVTPVSPISEVETPKVVVPIVDATGEIEPTPAPVPALAVPAR